LAGIDSSEIKGIQDAAFLIERVEEGGVFVGGNQKSRIP